jgi:predicted RNA-binding Zn-ribbon protein involved in translation (DUF1610 family)
VAHEYRMIARERLAKATALLAPNDNDSLIYACLEMRKCVEALAYDLLQLYLHEAPTKAFEVWQPDNVIKELLRIDTSADKSSRLSMQREATATEPAGEWKYIGEDRRLKVKRMQKIFNAMGSYIHVPTIRQLKESPEPDYAAIRKSVVKMRDELQHIVSAKMWGFHFNKFVTFHCSQCETPIKRTEKVLEASNQVECGNCGQFFNVSKDEPGEWYIDPVFFSWNCQKCNVLRELPQSEAKVGLDVTCPECKEFAFLSSVTSWRVNHRKDEPEPNVVD